MSLFKNDFDSYCIEEPSDEEDLDCSSEEDDYDFASFVENSIKRSKKKKGSEFEQEMNQELDETMAKLEASNKMTSKGTSESSDSRQPGSSSQVLTQDGQQAFYDDIYFDSDSEEEEPSQKTSKKAKGKLKHPVISNDDLFYDPEMDDEDQKWVNDNRRRYQPDQSKVAKLPQSDAVLSCPACMTTLCRDCQRHEIYSTQYRAMFVQNCMVNFSQILRYPTKNKKKARKRSTKDSVPSAVDANIISNDSSDNFHPVSCAICNTEVAVFDKEEIYHFFNVLTSYT